MLTPQEVEERAFPKAKKGGYDMADVDSFLDQITADYTDLYKDNAVLKRRMKTLADKITEYQETEGAMRATLRAAQKMAEQIMEDARTKSAKMLEESEAKARSQTERISAQVAEEEARLAAARDSLARVTASIRTVLAREQDFLDRLPEMDAAGAARTGAASAIPEDRTPEPEVKEETDDLERSFRRILENGEEPKPEPAAEYPEADAVKPEEKTFEKEPDVTLEDDFEDRFKVVSKENPVATPTSRPSSRRIVDDDVDDAPTRRLDLSELRFGKNYEVK